MIQSPQDTKFKKVAKTDSSSDVDEDDDDVEYVEYEITQVDNRVRVLDRRRNNKEHALNKKEKDQDESVTKVLSKTLRQPPSKDQNFTFPASTLGLKPEDGRIVVTDTTGAAALTQSPDKRFTLQTPLDDGPFCAMSISHTEGFNYSALHLYSDPIFAPLRILDNQMWVFRWRWNGLPILILPIAFLDIHDTYISDRLAKLHAELGQIESGLLAPSGPGVVEIMDFGGMTRRLHEFSTALSNLARRAHFQDTVLDTVTEALSTLNGGPEGWGMDIQRARLDGLKKAMLARRYDLEMMPKRELTARATIFNLTVQRDQALSIAIGQANLEIAHSARQIAEATMRDSAAMRTIAVLTMLFLPGTAVASFFSMTMFNWQPSGPNSSSSSSSSSSDSSNSGTSGTVLVSSYIWIYFVLAIPLTALVLGVWWWWQRTRVRRGEGGVGGEVGDLEMELQMGLGLEQHNVEPGNEFPGKWKNKKRKGI